MTRRAVALDLLESGTRFQGNILRFRECREHNQRYERRPGNDEYTNDGLSQFAFNVMFCITLLW
jgi:hypothetical protein